MWVQSVVGSLPCSERFLSVYSDFSLSSKTKRLNSNYNRPFYSWSVMDGGEAEGELVLIQTFLLYYVNQVILMLTSIFQEQFP